MAAESLRLLNKHTLVEAVITKPRPSHHKEPAPVLELCEELGLSVYIPADKTELTQLVQQTTFTSQLGLVIDYGIIIAKEVIDAFPLGIVNSHFSLLPSWRGADPITFAVLSGESKTGVSLMVIDEQMDTGKLITQKTLHMAADETTPSLTEKLIVLSDSLLQEFLPRYVTGEVKPHNQPHPDRATYSRKLTKQEGVLDWDKPADQLEREIRAFAGWPKSRTTISGKDVIITKATVVDVSAAPGTIQAERNRLVVAAKKDGLEIVTLQPAGKKEMTTQEFLRGYSKGL